jgi:hypothetical protein
MNQDYIEEKVKTHDETLFGEKGKMGLAHKVAVMWNAHVWILCFVSGSLGFIVRPWVENLLGHK